MYVLTECAFLTPRSSAIWLDSDEKKKNVRKKHREIMKCLTLSDPVSKKKTEACFKRRATAVLNWLDCSTTLARLVFRRRI